MTLCPCCGKPKKPKGLEALGTALKPAVEMIACARKPLAEGTVAAQVLATGTGALNVDACRVSTNGESLDGGKTRAAYAGCKDGWRRPFQDDAAYMTERAEIEARKVAHAESAGRWPSNVVHDNSPEVLAAFERFGASRDGVAVQRNGGGQRIGYGSGNGGAGPRPDATYGGHGSAARFFPALGHGEGELRFFYSGKVSRTERRGSTHPTMKPIALMRWLCRLVTPPGGRVLDPFAGSGSTGIAAMREGFDCILVEREAEYVEIIRARLAHEARAALGSGSSEQREERRVRPPAPRGRPAPIPQHDLFAELVA